MVIEIRGTENGDLVVPVNNTLVCCTTFLLMATDTQPCVLTNASDDSLLTIDDYHIFIKFHLCSMPSYLYYFLEQTNGM